MARKAKDVGIELFVMDDGWFGHRDDDTSSLGDWFVNEKKLKGDASSIRPPKHLSKEQKKIFKEIVKKLEASQILSDKDVYLLAEFSVSIDRLQEVERRINEEPELLFDQKVMSTKDKYTKIFFRGCNELGFSPQSRAKIANINMQEEKENPLLKVLMDDD